MAIQKALCVLPFRTIEECILGRLEAVCILSAFGVETSGLLNSEPSAFRLDLSFGRVNIGGMPAPPQGSAVFAPACPFPRERSLCPCLTLAEEAQSLPLPAPSRRSAVFAPAWPSPRERSLCPCLILPEGEQPLPLPAPPQGSTVSAPACSSPRERSLCPCLTLEKMQTCLNEVHSPLTCLQFNDDRSTLKCVCHFTLLYIPLHTFKFIPATRNMLWTKEMHNTLRFCALENFEKCATWKKSTHLKGILIPARYVCS